MYLGAYTAAQEAVCPGRCDPKAWKTENKPCLATMRLGSECKLYGMNNVARPLHRPAVSGIDNMVSDLVGGRAGARIHLDAVTAGDYRTIACRCGMAGMGAMGYAEAVSGLFGICW